MFNHLSWNSFKSHLPNFFDDQLLFWVVFLLLCDFETILEPLSYQVLFQYLTKYRFKIIFPLFEKNLRILGHAVRVWKIVDKPVSVHLTVSLLLLFSVFSYFHRHLLLILKYIMNPCFICYISYESYEMLHSILWAI